MLIQLLFIIFLGTSSQAADTPCVGKTDPMRGLMDLQNKSCEIRQKSPECQQLYANIKADSGEEELKSKALNCEKEAKATKLDALGERLTGCLVGGIIDPSIDFWNMVKDAPGKISNSIEERDKRSKECDANLEQKEAIFRVHNQGLPKVLQVPPPADLKSKTCAQLQTVLNSGRRTKNKNAAIHIDGKDRQLGPEHLSADEKEYLAWKKDKNREVAAAPNDNLIKLANKKMEEMQINYACYSPAAAWAIRCEILYGIATSLTGAGAVKAIAKMAGVKSTRIVLQTEKLANGAKNPPAFSTVRVYIPESRASGSVSKGTGGGSSSGSGAVAVRGGTADSLGTGTSSVARPSRSLDAEDTRKVPTPKPAAAKPPPSPSSTPSSSRSPASSASKKAAPEPQSLTRKIKYEMDLDEAYKRAGVKAIKMSPDPKEQVDASLNAAREAYKKFGTGEDLAGKVVMDNANDRLTELLHNELIKKTLTPELRDHVNKVKTKMLEVRHLNGKTVSDASVQELEKTRDFLAKKYPPEKQFSQASEADRAMLKQIQEKLDDNKASEMKQASRAETKAVQEPEARPAQEVSSQNVPETSVRNTPEPEVQVSRPIETPQVNRAESAPEVRTPTRTRSWAERQADEAREAQEKALKQKEAAAADKKARQERLEEAQREYKAGLEKKQRDYRNSSSAPKEARPLDDATKSDINRLMSKLEKNPSSLSAKEVEKLKSMRKDIEKKRTYSDHQNGYYGMLKSDEELASKLDSAVDKAAAAIKRKQGDSHHLAEQQGRKLVGAHDSSGRLSTKSHVNDIRKSVEDNLQAVQGTPSNFDRELIQFNPIIQSRDTMQSLTEKLSKSDIGISPQQVKSVNELSTYNLGDYGKLGNSFEDGQKFLERYENAQKSGKMIELQKTLSPSEREALDKAVKMMQHAREKYVPSHLQHLKD